MCVWEITSFRTGFSPSTMCPRDWVHVVGSGSVFTCWAISIPYTKLKCMSVLQDGVQDHREADLSEGHSLNDAWERTMWPTSTTLGSVSLVTFEVETENWPKEGPRIRIKQHQQWLREPRHRQEVGRTVTALPAKEKSQHSKSQLDGRKTWTVTSADPWEVRCLYAPSS